jgi:hemerythrin-like domain-containing protein
MPHHIEPADPTWDDGRDLAQGPRPHHWWNADEARWVDTKPSAEAADSAGSERPLVDVRDMVVVHTALLREFRLAPDAVVHTRVGDRRRAQAVSRHLQLLCDLLHHHHKGEDTLLWPHLRARTPTTQTAIFDEIDAQHTELDGALHRVHDLRSAWADVPDDTRGSPLTAALAELHHRLSAHLDLEERAVLPLAAAYLTTAEWLAVGEAAVAEIPKTALPLVFGMFAYEGDATVLRGMLSAAPPVPRALLPVVAPRVYARRARQIHRTATP